ncbi:hypothetical protein QYF36_001103 [Acer negundo]|nr:hypothetical protein QYF36_001103 [Acer negundo]
MGIAKEINEMPRRDRHGENTDDYLMSEVMDGKGSTVDKGKMKAIGRSHDSPRKDTVEFIDQTQSSTSTPTIDLEQAQPKRKEPMEIVEVVEGTFSRISGALPLVVESDVKGVVEIINKGVPTNADLGVMIDYIMSLVNNFLITIPFSPRKTNVVVHMLAKVAAKSVSSFSWLYYYPPSVKVLVMGEYPC